MQDYNYNDRSLFTIPFNTGHIDYTTSSHVVSPSRTTRRAPVKKAPVKKTPVTTGGTKLRLLVTSKCHNSCPSCCNKQFKTNDIPIVDRWNYDEVYITGGEPLLNNKTTTRVIKLVESIKAIWTAQGKSGKIYIDTASHRVDLLKKAARATDGLVYTIHNHQETHVLCAFVYQWPSLMMNPNKLFRLNYFKSEPFFPIPENNVVMRILRNSWRINELEWMPDCPIPDGEDFRRIRNLY